MFTYPRDILDSGDQLLALLGTFWSRTFGGRDQLATYTTGFGRLTGQAEGGCHTAVAALAPNTVPVYRREDWRVVYVRQSTITAAMPVAYGSGRIYNDGTNYGDDTPAFVVPVPGVASVDFVCNRLTNPSRTLSAGLDFMVIPAADGTSLLLLQADPFQDSRWAVRPVYDATGTVVDQELTMWLFRPGIDHQDIYQHFGILLGLELPSSHAYRQLVTAMLRAMVLGSSCARINAVLAAITGVPVATGGDTVQAVGQDRHGLLVITEQTTYRFPITANLTVAVGDVLESGQTLCDTFTVTELNQGTVPPGVISITIDPTLLSGSYQGGLTFLDQFTPLVVTHDASGMTRVSFELGGLEVDVQTFWDAVHARGLAAGTTLAHWLDVRGPDAGSEPTVASLPTTINPLAFLCQNVLRQNYVLLRIRPEALGDEAIGLSALRLLRRILPPHVAWLGLSDIMTAITT